MANPARLSYGCWKLLVICSIVIVERMFGKKGGVMGAQGVMVRELSGRRGHGRRGFAASGARPGAAKGMPGAGAVPSFRGPSPRPVLSRPAGAVPAGWGAGRVVTSCVVSGAPGSGSWAWLGRAVIGAIFLFGLFVVVSSFLEFSNEPLAGAWGALG